MTNTTKKSSHITKVAASISEMKNHKQRFMRSFMVAVLLTALGAAMGFCQTPEINGKFIEGQFDSPAKFDSPPENVSAPPSNSNNDVFLTNERPLWSSASFKSVLESDASKKVADVEPGPKSNWYSFIADAQAKSKELDRPMMILFTGSDWCITCQKLDVQILQSKQFRKWSHENIVIVEANFPRSYQLPQELAQQNEQLRDRYAAQLTTGFPAALFISADGDFLGKVRYTPEGPDAWIANANKVIHVEQAAKSPASQQDFGQSILR